LPNTLFDKGREAFLCGDIRWMKDTIRAALCSAMPDAKKDEYLTDVKTVLVSGPLTGKTKDNGVAGAGSTIFPNAAGEKSVAAVLFQDTGNPASSRLIALIDTLGSGKDFSIVPNGADIQINWANGANRIFKL
jgi:hypothetical protein